MKTPLSDPFTGQLEALAGQNGPLGALRREAAARFRELGLPHRKVEAWRYTNVAPLCRIAWEVADPSAARAVDPAAVHRFLLGLEEPYRLVLVNGFYAPELSALPEGSGLWVQSLRAALEGTPERASLLGRAFPLEEAAFLAINTALFTDGLYLEAAPGTKLDRPLQLIHVAIPDRHRPLAAYPRHLVRLEAGASLTLIEDYVTLGEGPTFLLPATEIFLADGARLDYQRLGREAEETAYHVGYVLVHQGRGSAFHSLNTVFGGSLVRNEIHVRLAGEEGHADLLGLTVARRRAHVDHHTRIHHESPACTSREVYKTILDDEARGVFNGKIYVAPGAQKTDAKQSNHALLLSRRAEMDAKPELEIYADDVRCTHGATVGQLDRDALFYLRSRGLPVRQAESLLLWAFANEVLTSWGHPELTETWAALVESRLQER